MKNNPNILVDDIYRLFAFIYRELAVWGLMGEVVGNEKWEDKVHYFPC